MKACVVCPLCTAQRAAELLLGGRSLVSLARGAGALATAAAAVAVAACVVLPASRVERACSAAPEPPQTGGSA